MHFKTATSIAVLACAASALARPDSNGNNGAARPYKAASKGLPMLRSMPNLSLMRRDTNGYTPEQSQCHDGNTCEEACGTGYTSCASTDNRSHCYNQAANEQCCSDGSGNSCDASYYCTHDHKLTTWCCPNSMDLDECAKAFSVDGALESAVPVPSKIASSSSAAPPSSTSSVAHSSTQAPTSASASASATNSAPASRSSAVSSDFATSSSSSSVGRTTEAVAPQPTVSEVEDQTSSAAQPSNTNVAAPAWTGANNTLPALPVQPSGNLPPAPAGTGAPVPGQPTTISGAASSGLSVLMLLAAGVVALL